MLNTNVVVEDNQVIRLVLDFLDSRKLHNSMRSLEKESGIVNCGFSDDILFLRDLVLDGEWEAILIFAQPFEGINEFDSRQFRYLVLKQKFMEVLYFKSGFGGNSTSYSIEDLIKCLNQLEEDCPNKAEYSKLCWLLTVPNLSEQPEYRDWNPTTARIKCFDQILDLLRKVIPIEKKGLNGKFPKPLTPIRDRLLHLLIKGLCFESCVDYCQLRAINGDLSGELDVCIGDNILFGPSQESSGNFLSWLKNLSQDAFITPFEPVSLEVDLKKGKQTPGFLYHKSPKRDDAEILSRSLSLSGRPATADMASHLSRLETEGNRGALSDNRPHSSQPLKRISQSYNEFHYKGSSENEPLNNAGNIGLPKRRLDSRHEGEEEVLAETGILNDDTNNVELEQDPSQPLVANGTDSSCDPGTIHMLKEQQQQNVLKQLEAYERQKQDLERQLLELSLRETANKKPNATDSTTSQLLSHRPESSDSSNGSQSKLLSNDVGFKSHPSHQPNGEASMHGPFEGNVNHVNSEDYLPWPQGSYQTPESVRPFLNHEKNDATCFSVTQVVTSTPATKPKNKPEDLNLADTKGSLTAYDGVPITPAEQTFPNTPVLNGHTPFGTGHWVALADGSGVLNTSTPKSTRQGLKSTPAPLASPILHVDGATPPCSIPLGFVKETPKDVVECNKTDSPMLPVSASDTVLDKENGVSHNQQIPLKRGPKVNGVRRALVPQGGSKHKIGAMGENKDIIIPSEGLSGNVPTPEIIKAANIGSNTPASHQIQSANVKMEPVSQGLHEGAVRENGQPKRSGMTFVVDSRAENQSQNSRAPSGDLYLGEKKPHKEPDNVIQKEREMGTVNMTFRKPSTNSPPNNTTVTINNGNHRNHISLLEKQREFLQSSSEAKFYTVATLEDVQAIRAIAFHPSGDLFAIGSNSKTLRVCTAEGLNSQRRMESKGSGQPPQPTILFKSNRHHRGSIYCVAWSATGDIIATGSNDKSIKMTRFDAETCSVTWPGLELAIHNGTVRDLAFVSRASGTPVLVSGGAGDGNIMISDCSTGQTIGQLKGHSGHVMAVYADSDDIIASGSADNTVRLWDLRSQRCIDAIATGDSCVASVCVNSSGNMLASGQEDGSCMIYDITAGRTLQLFKPHTMDCRSVRFSPDNNFLLTGSYDSSIILMDIRKDLETQVPPYSVVAHHRDKVIQCRWHPTLLAFLSSSADRTVSLWAPEC